MQARELQETAPEDGFAKLDVAHETIDRIGQASVRRRGEETTVIVDHA